MFAPAVQANRTIPGAATPMNDLKPSQIVTMASGAVMLLFSFFAWYKLGQQHEVGLGQRPVPVGVVRADLRGASRPPSWRRRSSARCRLPEPVLSFSWRQIHFILAFTALVIAVGYLLVDTGGIDKGVGFWFNLLGAIGLIVGAVMELLGTEGTTRRTSGRVCVTVLIACFGLSTQ